MTESTEKIRLSHDTKGNMTQRSIWIRLIYMIVLAIAFNVAEIVTFVVVVFHFLANLFTGQPNDRLVRFGRSLARYLQQIIVFMTFATEEKPFPFAPWPNGPDLKPPVEDDSGQANVCSGDNTTAAD